MIAIIDYGMGNVGSVFNMLRKLRTKVIITSKPEEIEAADKLILPGVGHFDRGMANLMASGLIELLNAQVLEQQKPVMGICLGMQMMTRGSEEGSLPGLGWVDAETRRFLAVDNLKIPHMGWNHIAAQPDRKLFDFPTAEPSRFYFVHSYYVQADRSDDVAAYCHYSHDFVAAFEVNNIMGVQFHPEKSHMYGMNLFRKFVAL